MRGIQHVFAFNDPQMCVYIVFIDMHYRYAAHAAHEKKITCVELAKL